jgi:serine/threonine-protein kinase RsbT
VPELRRTPINSDLDIVAARVEGRDLAKQMGFGIIDQARIATAISELARNVVLYAHCGQVTLKKINASDRIGIEIICEDQGPGIENLELVMRDGYSTTRGLGMGLPGTKRLVDEFEIKSQVGIGTTVIVRKWLV